MTFLTIASGPSVNFYPKEDLEELAKRSFTIAVNDSAFNFPCNMVCATDFQWIIDNYEKLKKLDIPVITREWEVLRKYPLTYVILDNDVNRYARLSGMIAAKMLDSMANRINRISFVIGMDNNAGHYYDKDSDCSKRTSEEDYVKLNLLNTINLGNKLSKIECWPKQAFLPHTEPAKKEDIAFIHLAISSLGTDLVKEGVNV